MTRIRAGIVVLAVVAIAICCGAVWWALSAAPQSGTSPGDAVLVALRWLVLPALCLLAGVQATELSRLFDDKAIDGRTDGVGHRLEINLRYNRNTVEQLVLAALAWPAVAIALPEQAAALFPVLAALFVAGRITFWAGYLWLNWARAFGFALTYVPTVAALLYAAMQLA